MAPFDILNSIELKKIRPMTKNELVAEIRALSVADQLDLMDEVWGSIELDCQESDVSVAYTRLMDERLTEFEQYPNQVFPLDAVVRELKEKS